MPPQKRDLSTSPSLRTGISSPIGSKYLRTSPSLRTKDFTRGFLFGKHASQLEDSESRRHFSALASENSCNVLVNNAGVDKILKPQKKQTKLEDYILEGGCNVDLY